MAAIMLMVVVPWAFVAFIWPLMGMEVFAVVKQRAAWLALLSFRRVLRKGNVVSLSCCIEIMDTILQYPFHPLTLEQRLAKELSC